jgi:deoxyribodipyrimidine photolyase-related protein
MDIFLILPNQLFENTLKHIKTANYKKIIIYEEPHYFSSDIKPNKIKIAYLRACMKYYYNNLITKEKIKNVSYCEFADKEVLTSNNTYYCYEITDYKLLNKYKLLNIKINEIETPMFILNKKDLDKYNKRKTISHSSLYELSKNKLGILKGIKNQDIYNRSNPKNNVSLNQNLNFINSNNKSYYEEGIKYSSKPIFKDHIGNATLDTLKIYPINSKDAYDAYENFLKFNLEKFGLYQDVIQDNNPFMYHAIISPMLNNGLLIPLELIKIIKKYESDISINSYEGFIRQIIGWREYMRYLYIYKYEELIKSNNFNNKNKLNNNWYSGTTGLLIIDNEIKKAITFGYAHHIIRLMIFLNFMILNEINPQDIYKWFMEVISIDAYDWVMISNIYSMGYFSKIGMKRPYLSSSNYLLKMSNYKKDDKWNNEWNNLFRSFVKSRNIKFYLRSIK